jgi:hypothetical protein
MGRFDEAGAAFTEAAGHGLAAGAERAMWYELGFLKKSQAIMEASMADTQGNTESDVVFAHVRALIAAHDGRIDEANRLARRAVDVAKGTGRVERAAVVLAAPAVWNAFYGNRELARTGAEGALKAFDGREVNYAAGFALGLAGEASRAEALAAKLDKAYPEDTQVQATYVPTLRALAALARNNPQAAIDLLEANRRYEFAIPPLAFNHYYGNMYSIYVRGLAYLSMNRSEEAAAEFTRLLEHPGLYAGDPVEAAARGQLARAWILAGNTVQVQKAVGDFLTLWANASPDLPLLRQVKTGAVGLHDRAVSGNPH